MEVSLGWIEGDGKGASRQAAATTLVERMLDGLSKDRLPVRGLLLFATPDWCDEDDASLPREIRTACRGRLGYDVPLIGASLGGLFCVESGAVCFLERGILLAAVASYDYWLTVVASPAPHAGEGRDRQRILQSLAASLRERADIRLGSSAARRLLAFTPGNIRTSEGEPLYLDNELHEEILAAFEYRYRLVGAAAAGVGSEEPGFQFANDLCLRSGLALALVETDLAFGTAMGHGFVPILDAHLSVDALADGEDEGCLVSRFDGQPAGERLARFRESQPPTSDARYLGAPSGGEYHVLYPMDDAPRADGCVRLNRRVRRGDRLLLLQTDRDRVARNAISVYQAAAPPSPAPQESVRLLCELTCSGRVALHERLGLDWKAEIRQLHDLYPRAVAIGGLCAGEFGIDRRRRSQANNVTFWVDSLSCDYAPRARTRALQRDLLRAAKVISDCQTPAEVMHTALHEACRAGATGGQICIVDHHLGLIVGLGHGCTYSPPDAGHDWNKVAEATERPISPSTDRSFPRDLLDYSMPLDPSSPPEVVDEISEELDILTLIVRSSMAVFVQDSQEDRFHCDKTAARNGGVKTFLAIPLVGAKGRVIATLQLSFPDGRPLDQERFGFWLGYSQKLASALERAQEADERSIAQAISHLGNEILQAPPADEKEQEYGWCEKYLHEVMRLLNADDAHMRVIMGMKEPQSFRLVAAVGLTASLRKTTRPETREGDGSCNLELLKAGGKFTNTALETKELNASVRAKDGTPAEAEFFGKMLQSFEATAMLPLQHESQILGSLVIDSVHRYFFTERKQRLARAAADLAGTILRGRRDAYVGRAREAEQTELLRQLSATKADASILGLEGLLRRLCRVIDADVGSLFLWCPPVGRLVLHTAHNWHRPMEGEANYKPGEGWTGEIALDPETITRADLIKPGSFLRKLQSRGTPFVGFLVDQLSTPTRDAIGSLQEGTSPDVDLVERIAAELSDAIRNHRFWNSKRFSANTHSLRKETQRLAGAHPPCTGQALRRLNRLLLEDAFPNEIFRRTTPVYLLAPERSRLQEIDRKYYEQAVPPEHRVGPEDSDPRIGLRLQTSDTLVGVVTLSYFKGKRDKLRDADQIERFSNFLTAVADLVTLAVREAQSKAQGLRTGRLLKARGSLSEILVGTDKLGAMLRSALSEVLGGFGVERAAFYEVNTSRITCRVAREYEDAAAVENRLGSGTAPPLEDLLWNGEAVMVTDPGDSRLRNWPEASGLRTLYTVPAKDSQRQIRGVLELANRKPDRDHPFEFLDETECFAARDIAELIAKALESRAQTDAARVDAENRARLQAVMESSKEKAETEKAMRSAFEDFAHQIKSPLSEAARRVERTLSRLSPGQVFQDLESVATLLRRAELTARLIGLFEVLAKGQSIYVRGVAHQPADLVNLATQVCENQRPRISARKEISIQCDVDSLWKNAPTVPTPLMGDTELILQALSNLVDNAVKYSKSRTTIVVFGARTRKGRFYLGVTNKGIPITPTEVHLVKQRNWRGPEASRCVGEGTGLGLWIVDNIMRAHGGELQVLPTNVDTGITELRLVFGLA